MTLRGGATMLALLVLVAGLAACGRQPADQPKAAGDDRLARTATGAVMTGPGAIAVLAVDGMT